MKKTETNPVAYIAIGKQRVKQYDDIVYLKNNQSFEIELFNPTQNKILAKIDLNDNSIGSGIVLRPGERVFLERFLDNSKKFLFETYTVNGSNDEVKKAIANNGNVDVEFYNQWIPSPTYYSNPLYYNYTGGYWLGGIWYGNPYPSSLTYTSNQSPQ